MIIISVHSIARSEDASSSDTSHGETGIGGSGQEGTQEVNDGEGKVEEKPVLHDGKAPVGARHADTASYWNGLRVFDEHSWKFEEAHPQIGFWQPAVCVWCSNEICFYTTDT